jgi:hypothetical protein
MPERKEYEWRDETKLFRQAVPKLSFPSDGLTYGNIRTMWPELNGDMVDEVSLPDNKFYRLIDAERELALMMFIRERHGANAFNGAINENTVGESMPEYIEELKTAYEEVSMVHGDAAFAQQVRTIEDSVKTYVRNLGK